MRDGDKRLIPFNRGHNTDGIKGGLSGSQDLPVMQRRAGRKNTVDPITYIVFFYVVLNLVLFSVFGWLYHSLDRRIAGLSKQLEAYEQIVFQSNPPLPEQEGAGSPATSEETGLNEQNNSNNASSAAAAPSRAYTAVTGDTWWDICQRFYGDGGYYQKLIDYNKMKREDLIRGLVIQIPPKEELNSN